MWVVFLFVSIANAYDWDDDNDGCVCPSELDRAEEKTKENNTPLRYLRCRERITDTGKTTKDGHKVLSLVRDHCRWIKK